jgi:hypothetical protein
MRLIRAWRGESGAEMPLARYFLFIGGVLLALLLISGWVLPKFPMTETAGIGADKGMGTDKDMGTDKPFVRINSDQKWPERVVFDTSVAPIAPAPTVSAEEAVTPPAPPTVVDVTAKVRDAFAQLEPPELKNQSRSRNGNAKSQRSTLVRRGCWSPNSRGLAFSSAIFGRTDRRFA